MAGTFRVESTFTIPGRGFVIAGDIATGTVRIGGRVVVGDINGGTHLVRVTAISMGRRGGGELDVVGLLLDELHPDEAIALRERLVTGSELAVEDPAPGYEPPPRPPPLVAPRPWWKLGSAT